MKPKNDLANKLKKLGSNFSYDILEERRRLKREERERNKREEAKKKHELYEEILNYENKSNEIKKKIKEVDDAKEDLFRLQTNVEDDLISEIAKWDFGLYKQLPELDTVRGYYLLDRIDVANNDLIAKYKEYVKKELNKDKVELSEFAKNLFAKSLEFEKEKIDLYIKHSLGVYNLMDRTQKDYNYIKIDFHTANTDIQRLEEIHRQLKIEKSTNEFEYECVKKIWKEQDDLHKKLVKDINIEYNNAEIKGIKIEENKEDDDSQNEFLVNDNPNKSSSRSNLIKKPKNYSVSSFIESDKSNEYSLLSNQYLNQLNKNIQLKKNNYFPPNIYQPNFENQLIKTTGLAYNIKELKDTKSRNASMPKYTDLFSKGKTPYINNYQFLSKYEKTRYTDIKNKLGKTSSELSSNFPNNENSEVDSNIYKINYDLNKNEFSDNNYLTQIAHFLNDSYRKKLKEYNSKNNRNMVTKNEICRLERCFQKCLEDLKTDNMAIIKYLEKNTNVLNDENKNKLLHDNNDSIYKMTFIYDNIFAKKIKKMKGIFKVDNSLNEARSRLRSARPKSKSQINIFKTDIEHKKMNKNKV